MRRHAENTVYFGTDRKIIKAVGRVLKNNRSFGIKTREVSREAKVANSSFYIHYRSLTNLIEENENKILVNLNTEIKRIMKNKDHTLESGYRNILLVLYKYRDFLTVIIETENIGTLIKIAKYLKPFTTEKWGSYGEKANKQIFSQFTANFIAEIFFWKRERFSVDEIPYHAHNLTFLTIDAPKTYAKIYYK